MANFVYDSFTASDGVDLITRAGETGATWTQHSNSPSGSAAISGNELVGGTYNNSFFYASGAPAGAEYDVVAPLHVVTAGTDLGGGVIGRVDTTADTMYQARHHAGVWSLFKRVAGTETLLGSYAQVLTAGATYVLKLEIRNATKKLLVDGVERVSSADNSITAAGKAGVWAYFGDPGLAKLSDVTATDAVLPATATTLSGPSSGTVSVASSNFTVGADGPITGTVIVTPSDGGGGGTFSPTTVSISSGTPTGTFTYTPASTGAKTISTTNNGGLSNPTALTYTSNAAADTTPPTLTSPTGTSTGTTTASGTVTTNEANGTLYALATINATETAATVKASANTQVITTTGSKSVSFTGLTASTTYYAHYVHRDAAGNDSTRVSSASFTTSASGDTTKPTMNGTITSSAITQSGFTISWPAGSDDVGVTGYEYSTNGGSTWADIGNVLTKAVTGLAASTAYSVQVRDYDAAGNRALTPLAATVTTSAGVSGTFTTDVVTNNTGSALVNTAMVWSWLPAGRIGSLAAVTPVDGTGTTSAGGTLTASGLSSGTAGVLMVAKRNTSALDDDVYYQAGTVA